MSCETSWIEVDEDFEPGAPDKTLEEKHEEKAAAEVKLFFEGASVECESFSERDMLKQKLHTVWHDLSVVPDPDQSAKRKQHLVDKIVQETDERELNQVSKYHWMTFLFSLWKTTRLSLEKKIDLSACFFELVAEYMITDEDFFLMSLRNWCFNEGKHYLEAMYEAFPEKFKPSPWNKFWWDRQKSKEKGIEDYEGKSSIQLP